MKAITIEQPFASLISIGIKTIEVRPWYTDYRGSLAIHSAETFKPVDDPYYQSLLSSSGLDCEQLPLGKIVAIARLVGCKKVVASNIPCYPELAFNDFVLGWYALELVDIHPVEIPVRTEGDDLLWDWG